MDFDNFRLFVMSNTFFDTQPTPSDPSPATEHVSEDEDDDWSHVNPKDFDSRNPENAGCPSASAPPQAPAPLRIRTNYEASESDSQITTHHRTAEDRLSRSLDLGHGTLNNGVDDLEGSTSNSIPWESGRSRTLDRSAARGHGASAAGQLPETTKKSSAIDGNNTDQAEKLKVRLMSVWNNMKYGWTVKTKTSFKCDSPIWFLGKCYHCTKAEQEEERRNNKMTNSAFERFKRDLTSRIWFTYRKDFPILPHSQISTDVGWGCMLRSGQMLLAQALVTHYLGREWRWHALQRTQDEMFHHQIIKFFGDQLGDEIPFSIHKLVQIGSESGKRPGDWYGPASVAYVLREAMEQASETNPILSHLCLYVSQDCTVYKQDIIDQCTRKMHSSRRGSTSQTDSTSSEQSQGPEATHDEHWHSVIILIPVRLGGESLNPIYIPCMQSMLAHDLCLGIMGGKPKHSLYFVGWQDDKLIHMDPHFCQDNVDVRQRDFPLHSFHCLSPRKMAFTKMDPSCTIGFYCRTKADFFKFVHEIEMMVSPPKERGLYPMFVFHEGRSIDVSLSDEVQQPQRERYLRVRRLDRKGRVKTPAKESDDFVFL